MMQCAYGEALKHARDLWLGELKRGIWIDVHV
jgi:hypothetical protein